MTRSIHAMPRLLAVVLPALLAMSPVQAEPDEPDGFLSPAPVMALPPMMTLGAGPVSDAALDGRRGGAETLNDMDLEGVVAGNHASNLVTGQNIVTDGSLTGNAGFATVVQNSGNNVLIQNATIVNIQLE
ncbi:hypothetical protein [Denitromonas iodatirespirans]|uniref:Uncharacterized protein n=1 Tax=Denitromonas iodatirespirans TaxID=2795389 RepID=A0A944DEB5_DENI1|nr:hypothetical protein [Denitromonas iodatirespirans]MBT0963486.1 hypothetical protein [Denitromonas iodatirespirans]